MQRLNIPQIITFLKAQGSVSALLGDRIYWGLPKAEQAGTYLCISEISEIQDVVDAFSRVEFRFIAKDDNTTWANLQSAERAITDLIANQGGVDFGGGFNPYKIVLGTGIFQGYDEKKRRVYLRDFFVYYLN